MIELLLIFGPLVLVFVWATYRIGKKVGEDNCKWCRARERDEKRSQEVRNQRAVVEAIVERKFEELKKEKK